jgi:hypothetical protein
VSRFVVFAFCPLLSGCFAFGYPSICATPAVAVDAPDARAFLVSSGFREWGPWITGPFSIWHEVKQVPIAAAKVQPQWNSHFTYCYFVFPFAAGAYSQAKEIVLYRPGYETVSFPVRNWLNVCGKEPLRVMWKAAPDLDSQV